MSRSARYGPFARCFGLGTMAAMLSGCPPPNIPDVPDPPLLDSGPRTFTFDYRHRTPAVSVTATVGLWMHREQRFDRGTIANWLAVPFGGKELLEPINALWVDPFARSEQEATDNVVRFLGDCRFRREGDVFFGLIPQHSRGYHAFYGTGAWRPQYDVDDAWVQGFFGGDLPNNHGRIFPTAPFASAAGTIVYLTSGAFSREGGYGNPFFLGVECLLKREVCHPYLSFDAARDALNCGARAWALSGVVDFGNRYHPSSALSFSTDDHSGVLVFERTGR